MAEVRQVPLDEYESMKKSYGFSDEQMKSIVGIEPFAKRWADGYGESRKEVDEVKLKHQKLVEEINKKLKNQNSSSENSKTESSVNKVVEEIKAKESKTLADADVVKSESVNTQKNDAVKTEEAFKTGETVKVEENSQSFDAPVFEPVQNKENANESFDVPVFEAVPEENKEPQLFDAPMFEPVSEETQSFDVPSFEPVEMEAPSFEPIVEDVPSFEMPVSETVKTEEQSFDTPTFEPVSNVEEQSSDVPVFEAMPEEKNDDKSFDVPAFDSIPQFTVSKESDVVERKEEVLDSPLDTKIENVASETNTTFTTPIFEEPVEREEEVLVTAPTYVEPQSQNLFGEEASVSTKPKTEEELRDEMFEKGRNKLLELLRADYLAFRSDDFSK